MEVGKRNLVVSGEGQCQVASVDRVTIGYLLDDQPTLNARSKNSSTTVCRNEKKIK